MPLQVSFVGMTEEAAKDTAKKGGFEQAVKTVKTSFKANSKVRASSTNQPEPKQD